MWSYDDDSDTEQYAVKVRRLIRNPDICHAFSRFCSLYTYLHLHPPKSAKTLLSSVYHDKAGILPFFTEDMAQQVVKLWGIVHNPTRYSEYVHERFTTSQKGGNADTDRLDGLVDRLIGFLPTTGYLGTAVGYAGWLASLPTRFIDYVLTNPYVGGPILAKAIDIFLEVMPNVILLIEEGGTLLSAPLAPLGIGFLLEAAVLFVSEFLAAIVFLLSLARNKKGAAFVNFLQMIPILGPLLRLGIVTGARVYNRVFPASKKANYTQAQPQIQDGAAGGRRRSRGRTRRAHTEPSRMGRTRRRV